MCRFSRFNFFFKSFCQTHSRLIKEKPWKSFATRSQSQRFHSIKMFRLAWTRKSFLTLFDLSTVAVRFSVFRIAEHFWEAIARWKKFSQIFKYLAFMLIFLHHCPIFHTISQFVLTNLQSRLKLLPRSGNLENEFFKLNSEVSRLTNQKFSLNRKSSCKNLEALSTPDQVQTHEIPLKRSFSERQSWISLRDWLIS